MPKHGPPTMVVVKEAKVPELPDLSEDFPAPSSSNFDQNLSDYARNEPMSIDDALKSLFTMPEVKNVTEEEKQQFDFNFDINLPEISTPKAQTSPKRTRKNKNYSYRQEYDHTFPGIQRSRKGSEFYYCSVCNMDFILGRNGPRAIRQHVKSKKHVQIEKEKENLEMNPIIHAVEGEVPEVKKKKKSSSNKLTASYALYRQEYGDQFHGITESVLGAHYFYCTFCEKDLLFGKDGVKAIQRHVTSQKHIQRDDKPELCASVNFKGFSFRSEYITKFPGINESSKGEAFFYCTVCEKDLMLARSGSKAIGLHLLSAKHIEISKEKTSNLLNEVANNTEIVEISCGAPALEQE